MTKPTRPERSQPSTYRGLELDRFQIEAIEALMAGHSVLVCAPTGTGKTVVADWAVERALDLGRHVIYTAPIKALSNQKFRDYCEMFGEEQVGLVTGDIVIRRDAPCRVMTTEILRNMLLTGEDLPNLAAVVVDEIHFLDDAERGTAWEEILIYLPRHVQVVGLSATLSNLSEFAAWLRFVREREIVVVEEHRRAVPLTYRIATREGGLLAPADMERFYKKWHSRHAHAIRNAKRKRRMAGYGGRRRLYADRIGFPTRHTTVFKQLFPEFTPYLYFVFSRRDAEGYARQLSHRVPEGLLSREERRAVYAELLAFRRQPGADAALDPALERLYLQGIAFHHAGLHVLLKVLVERLYERKLVKVLYCTGTFALGINMPARAAVFDGLMRFDGLNLIPLPTREFMQMAGRAGRRGLDDEGMVVVRSDIDDYPEVGRSLKTYLGGRTEPVHSCFSLSFHSVAHLLHRAPPDRIRSIVERSFLAFHRARMAEQDRLRAEAMAEQLASKGWKEGQMVPHELKRQVKRLRRLKAKAEAGANQTWREFRKKVEFLERWGYIESGENGEVALAAGARVLLHIQFQEIFTTELFLAGEFEQLSMPELFGLLCAMCTELPRGAFAPNVRRYQNLVRRVERIRYGEPVVEAEGLTRAPVTWDPQMIPLGRAWADGRSLAEILMNLRSTADVAGDLVGAFRRAKDLASQLRDVWAEVDPPRADQVRSLIRSVSRDEVEVVE